MSKETTELKNSIGDVFYRCTVTDNYIYQDWSGNFLTLEDVVNGSTHGLDMLEKFKLHVMVNNNSKLKGSWDHANEWIANVWLPRAKKLDLRKLSHIVSADIFTALSGEEFKETLEGEIENRFFENFEDAEKWALQK